MSIRELSFIKWWITKAMSIGTKATLGHVLERGRLNGGNWKKRFGKDDIILVSKAKGLEMKLVKCSIDLSKVNLLGGHRKLRWSDWRMDHKRWGIKENDGNVCKSLFWQLKKQNQIGDWKDMSCLIVGAKTWKKERTRKYSVIYQWAKLVKKNRFPLGI